jgi:hypothetical protein
MKNLIVLFTTFLLLVFISCKKEPPHPNPNPNPEPVDTATIRSFRLVFNAMPGQTNVLTGLSAIVTIENEKNEIVLKDKKVELGHNQKYSSELLSLKKGNYKITGLIIKQGDTVVRFASPIRGSAKSALVNNPLMVPFSLEEKAEKHVSADLLPVEKADRPEAFGYPAGTFGERPGENNPPRDLKIFVRPLIKIGDIVYDSIPVTLVLRTWDKNENMVYKSSVLPAGTQEITLSSTGERYQLSISKWGTYDQITLLKSEVLENTVYSIGGSAIARKLKSLYTYKITNGNSVPETKWDYEYGYNGRIEQILKYGKRADLSNYLAGKEVFEYQGDKINRVLKYLESNQPETNTMFNYNVQGKITTMEEFHGLQRTTAAVHYTTLPGSTGISHNHRIEINYDHLQFGYTSYYNMTIQGGMNIMDHHTTSHGNSIQGSYYFDFNINPFAHLNIPDFSFSNYSRHNKTAETKIFNNVYPQVEPYSFIYTYNSEGYPTELLTKYRSYDTKVDLYTIKTVFTYN